MIAISLVEGGEAARAGTAHPDPDQLNESHEAHAERHAAGEEQHEVHRAYMGSSLLGSQEANQHGNDGHRYATSRCRIHIVSSKVRRLRLLSAAGRHWRAHLR
jgi:hypothetical protein